MPHVYNKNDDNNHYVCNDKKSCQERLVSFDIMHLNEHRFSSYLFQMPYMK